MAALKIPSKAPAPQEWLLLAENSDQDKGPWKNKQNSNLFCRIQGPSFLKMGSTDWDKALRILGCCGAGFIEEQSLPSINTSISSLLDGKWESVSSSLVLSVSSALSTAGLELTDTCLPLPPSSAITGMHVCGKPKQVKSDNRRRFIFILSVRMVALGHTENTKLKS